MEKALTLNLPLRNVNSGDSTFRASKSLAANAGQSVLTSIKVPVNSMLVVRARVRVAAGAFGPIAVTADSTTELLTKVAHGIPTGTPVFVVGTVQPGGVTATTLYFARAASADTISLYDTKAHAAAGGGTGLTDITSNGTVVILTPVCLNGYYILDAVVRNQFGKTTLLGAVNAALTLEDIAAWDVTITANDTTDILEFKGTPDVDLVTRFEIEAAVEQVSLQV